jgi:hypothetical protein
MIYIGDANDTATILVDADTFFLSAGYFAATDTDESRALTFIRGALFDSTGRARAVARQQVIVLSSVGGD